jgi:hypothetical protein
MAMETGAANQSRENELLVFWTKRESVCGECGLEMAPGALLKLEDGKAFCLDCADLGHLEFLPRGNTALTRRSQKYSTLSAVVLKFSRARKRYERQGLLVDPAAVERAEQECLGDAEARAASRERAGKQRERADEQYVRQFTEEIQRQFPACPPDEAQEIALHACRKYSGRVGRSAAAKALDETPVTLAVRAHVRHVHTQYDALLGTGCERFEARSEVESDVERKMAEWRG